MSVGRLLLMNENGTFNTVPGPRCRRLAVELTLHTALGVSEPIACMREDGANSDIPGASQPFSRFRPCKTIFPISPFPPKRIDLSRGPYNRCTVEIGCVIKPALSTSTQ